MTQKRSVGVSVGKSTLRKRRRKLHLLQWLEQRRRRRSLKKRKRTKNRSPLQT
jgi:hypothetical protein